MKLFVLSLSGLLIHTVSVYGQMKLNPSDLNTEAIRPALIYMDFGSPEYLTIETIYPVSIADDMYWAVTHRSQRFNADLGNGYDYYLVNQETLLPKESHMYHKGFTNYRLEFEKDHTRITIVNPTDSVNYSISTSEYIAPEGPGNDLFLASLPLTENYHITYKEINRWTGSPPYTAKIEENELKVVGSELIEIEYKSIETYKVVVSSDSGRYTEFWVLKESPHYIVQSNHKVSEDRFIKAKAVRLFIFDS